MTQEIEPSYTDLTYEVLMSAGRPLTFQEVFDDVNRRRPVTTRNPKGTIRNALTQGRQLVSTGDGRYGYLPQLVEGSLLRVPLTEKKPADHPLIYPDEVRQALWPSFFESQKRSNRRPVQVRLPNGEEVTLSLDFLGRGVWGSSMPEGLRRYLAENHASAGASLLIRIIDGEAGRAEAWLESRLKRDDAAVARRNRELADAVYPLIRKSRAREMLIWDLAFAVLARGLYRSDVPPDPLATVLEADPRFVNAGMESFMLAEDLTPERRAHIRQREKLESELFGLEPEPPTSIEETPSLQSMRRSMEQTLADMGAVLSEREFGSVEEANAFLQQMVAKGGIPHREAATPLEKAQDLMFDAWESPNRRERIRLAKEALEVSPDCADAYVLLAEETAVTPQEAADLYAKGVAAGERALGKETFQQEAGHFWGMIETRPYMRARAGLAQALWAMGKRHETIAHVWDMLRLNPGDNQGMRYLLLNWLLEMGDDVQTKKLLDAYPDDGAGVWLYGQALHAFRTEGDSKRARMLRAEAKQGNSHVSAYLSGRKRLPKRLPEMIGVGDENEAIYCTAEQGRAWLNTRGAVAWLDKSGE